MKHISEVIKTITQRMTTLTLPYPPSANVYWRSVRGRVIVSEDAKQYKETAGWMARLSCTEPMTGDLIVSIDVYRPRRTGDLDNRVKVALDALIGTAYCDDSQIVELHARRFDDKKNPRVVVTIRQAGDV